MLSQRIVHAAPPGPAINIFQTKNNCVFKYYIECIANCNKKEPTKVHAQKKILIKKIFNPCHVLNSLKMYDTPGK